MITFDTVIYMDALGLLLSGKTDIRAEIQNQIEQGDPCLDNILSDLIDEAENKKLNTEEIQALFEDASVESLMNYISYNEEKITFDYGESAACSNLRCVAFNIPCQFDSDKYFTDNTK